MKVLLVNTMDIGGAANACLRLHKGLLNNDIQSKVLLKNKRLDIPSTFVDKSSINPINRKQRISNKGKRILKEFGINIKGNHPNGDFLKSRSKGLEAFSFPDSKFDITRSKIYFEADVINLHWVAHFLDYPTFFHNNIKPIIWTFHDMNPFTGGEHYTEMYYGIDDEGYPKKRQLTEIEKQTFREILEIKIKAIPENTNIHIVALCHWMVEEIKKSKLFNRYPIHIIPNGLDTNIFKPIDKKEARKILNLPINKKIVLIVKATVNIERKGFDYLKKAIDKLELENILFCAVGPVSGELAYSNQLIELGYINDERLMSVAYSAADVFIIPSLMDNLPNTVLESLLCGTPCIGFPVGGIVDLIIPGFNGYLTNEISVPSLVSTIKEFFENYDSFDTELIRMDAKQKFSLDVQAKNYIELLNSILSNKTL